MNGVLDWGVDVVVWFQQFSPALDVFFELITELGTQAGYMALVPLVYWCLDKPLGLRLSFLLPISHYINVTLKAWFDTPRPYEYAPNRVIAIKTEPTRGLPSNHAQTTSVMWGYMAFWVRRRWLWVLSGLLVLLVGLSRLYLGVHFPTDVLGGWLLGLLLLPLFGWLEPQASQWLRVRPLSFQLGASALVSLALFGPRPGENEAKLAGTLLGVAWGVAWEHRWLRFVTYGSLWEKAARYALGLMGVVGLLGGLKLFFPQGQDTLALAFDWLRYGVVGWWAAFGAPWLFVRLGLAQRSSNL